jgi:hypothetical protein
MIARIVPFPSVRRVAFVRRQARSTLQRSPAEAERYIQLAIQRQRDVLAKKGVTSDLLERDVRALEAAIRAALSGERF